MRQKWHTLNCDVWSLKVNTVISVTTGAAGICSPGRKEISQGWREASRKLAYKLTFKLFKTIFIDQPRVFRMEGY
jgi:hypothetical protein